MMFQYLVIKSPSPFRQNILSDEEAEQRVVELKASDGAPLKATFFPAAKPGPGVLLFPESNRTRTCWDDVARQLAAAGINTLTFDTRGHGESAGRLEDVNKNKRTDVETAFQFLVSQPGVQREVIGLGSAGSLGVINALQTAQLHPNDIKSLVMLSGDAFRPLVEFLHQAPQLPELFVVSDTDEYPPTVETMLWLYARASSPGRRLIRYPAAQDAPWLWYETSDASKVPGTGSHGTDLFQQHADLPGMLVEWFVNTLIKTPGRAPAEPLATAAVLNQLECPVAPRRSRSS
jgi:pimeloyl-ACP methyl ester carboxylesterase